MNKNVVKGNSLHCLWATSSQRFKFKDNDQSTHFLRSRYDSRGIKYHQTTILCFVGCFFGLFFFWILVTCSDIESPGGCLFPLQLESLLITPRQTNRPKSMGSSLLLEWKSRYDLCHKNEDEWGHLHQGT